VSDQYGVAVGRDYAETRAISTAQLLGQVLFLVAVALAFLGVGTMIGREMAVGSARIISFVGLGMLLVASFAPGERFRVGSFAIGWLFATALALGIGLGPVIEYFATVQPTALTQAALGTAATVAGTGALGFFLSKDLAPWIKPLSLFVFVACLGTIVWSMVAGELSPIVSGIIYLGSAALIVVYFNYLRKHATERDTVWLATGIFVGIINIFTSLLNIFSD
jgi:modulator of FtsH protease